MPTKTKKAGRKKGSRNKGYFYRAGKGWTAQFSDGSQVLLRNSTGVKLVDRREDAKVVADAFARLLAQRAEQAKAEPATGAAVTVAEVCRAYLDHCKNTDRPSTHKSRWKLLFNLCTGFPGSLRAVPNPPPARRIHAGYGSKLASQFKVLDINEWIAKHPKWIGSKQMAKSGVKRAFRYAIEAGLIEDSAIAKMKVGQSKSRNVWFTAEQEAALYEHSKAAFKTALKVCIRTGARFGCEFAKLERRHVKETPRGMVWVFSVAENKTGAKTKKERVILVPPDIATITREQMAKRIAGPIFRQHNGKPWAIDNLSREFRHVRAKLLAAGIELDPDSCMYATRHTFAKAMLNGYWTGRACSIVELAALMGNSPEVCLRHYARWVDSQKDMLWNVLGAV